MKVTGRKIHRFTNYHANTFEDFLLIAAADIEDAWIQAGLEDADYTKLDVMREATRLASAAFVSGDVRPDMTLGICNRAEIQRIIEKEDKEFSQSLKTNGEYR